MTRGWADQVWTIGIGFGTVGLRKDGTDFEITTYRSEHYERGSRKPDVVYGTSLEDDLSRRDFTVNAMAARLPGYELVDPFGGLADLKARVLRTPASPEESFDADPLRILRAARFVARLGLSPRPELLAAMGRAGPPAVDRVRRADLGRADQAHPVAAARRPGRGDPAAGGHRRGRRGAAGDPGAAAGDGRALPAQGRLPALADRAGPGHRPGGAVRPARRTWCCGWPRCCTTSASRRPGPGCRATGSRSTITRWSGPRWPASG